MTNLIDEQAALQSTEIALRIFAKKASALAELAPKIDEFAQTGTASEGLSTLIALTTNLADEFDKFHATLTTEVLAKGAEISGGSKPDGVGDLVRRSFGL
ncbi:MAG: hypothetical protein AAFY22_10580 [Pseudomonadota bacterium]